MNNPFIYEGFATGELFCGRKDDLNYLKELVSYSNNLVLFSKRRMGKSSLLQELIQNQLDDSFICIYIDLFEISSKIDFLRLTAKQTANALPFTINSGISELVKIFKNISFSIDINNDDGSLSFNPKIITSEFDEAIDDYFISLNKYIENSNKKAIVIFDEFQQITNIKDKKIDAIIRKHIQSHKNISYIFSGSKKHLLTGLFSNINAPLYQMATFKELTPIDESDFFEFANKKLKYSISQEVFSYIYQTCNCESKLIQEVLFHIYKENIKNLTINDIKKIVNEIIDEKASSFRLIFDMLSNSKKTALKILSQTKNIYSKKILEKYDITKPTLQSALNKLNQEENLIEQKAKEYIFDNRLFELWCKRL
ncbi:MAG: ATP-binding protein [Arcobacteraceae bacterium]|nr:ATP-binding protein [Arcobacteraceae bacterium]